MEGAWIPQGTWSFHLLEEAFAVEVEEVTYTMDYGVHWNSGHPLMVEDDTLDMESVLDLRRFVARQCLVGGVGFPSPANVLPVLEKMPSAWKGRQRLG